MRPIYLSPMREFFTGAVSYSFILQIVCYVFSAMALFAIAKRRGIRKYGLAWLPFGNLWILGSIADQYQYVTAKKIQHKRIVLLGLRLGFLLFSLYAVGQFMLWFWNSAAYGVLVQPNLIALLCCGLGVLVFGIAYAVYYYAALYRVYGSCAPDNAVLFLLLSIFFPATAAFFLFFCRHKDAGMPPRYETEEYNECEF